MPVLDNMISIRKYDRSGILATIESLPDQCLEAEHIGLDFDPPKSYKIPYRNIVCTGLGGSAIASDILRSYLWYEVGLPLFVNRNYRLPGFVDSRTLVIVSSYSGDTEETICAYRDARKRKAKVIAATTGGALKRLAENDGVPVILIPEGMQPRCATAYLFFPVLILLRKLGIVKNISGDIAETIKVLDGLRLNKIGPGCPEKKNIAKQIARLLYKKYPVIYASQDHMDCVVSRWRGELSENAKTLSSGGFLPEINHNEIVGWQNPREVLKNFIVLMFRSSLDHLRISRRMDITKKLLEREGVKFFEMHSSGRSRLAGIFSLVYIGDMVSFYLAILNKTDPATVDRITYLKKALKQEG